MPRNFKQFLTQNTNRKCVQGWGVLLLLLGNHTKFMAITIGIQGNRLDLTMQITHVGKDSLLFPTRRFRIPIPLLCTPPEHKESAQQIPVGFVFDLLVLCFQSEAMA